MFTLFDKVCSYYLSGNSPIVECLEKELKPAAVQTDGKKVCSEAIKEILPHARSLCNNYAQKCCCHLTALLYGRRKEAVEENGAEHAICNYFAYFGSSVEVILVVAENTFLFANKSLARILKSPQLPFDDDDANVPN